MSELLQSVAYNNLHSSNSLCWNSHDLGFLNAADSMSLAAMDDTFEPSFSPTESDLSTGYLEDALVEFSSSKRRRLLLYASEAEEDYQNDHLLKRYWSSCSRSGGVGDGDVSENFNWMNQVYDMNNYDSVSAGEYEYETSPKSRSRIEDQTNMNLWSREMMKTSEFETFSTTPHYYEDPNSSSSSSKHHSLNAELLADSDKQPIFSIDSKPLSGDGSERKKKMKLLTKRRVVYPFAMVKPGGVEGDMTLKDINQKILMPPTRPVRHPVGDFACRPCVSAADGTGLSGKAVVALTRIHTQGRRGTITIIRTKG